MKRIIFLIIASLMVLGLVLPGCTGGGGGGEAIINVAVVGPLTDIQGQNHLGGAQMARDEINAGWPTSGGVVVNGTRYKINLVEVETAETTELTGLTGKANLLAAITNSNITFCVGGFRTEDVSVYRDVAMDAHKVFMNCGAATGSLQYSVVSNYSKYKYWFKTTPYNESFLVKSCFKMAATIAGVLNGTLYYDYYVLNMSLAPAYTNFSAPMRVAILMENTAWCAGMIIAAQYYLPAMGFTVTNGGLAYTVDPTATDISTTLNAIKATNPHIIFTAFSGSVGATFSNQKASLGVPGMVIGINVPAQQQNHWANTGGNCLGEVELDTFAENVSSGTGTVAWFNNYVTRFGRYPLYTAATYDAVKLVCRAIAATNSFNGDDLVTWLENPANAMTDSVASPKAMTYPLPAIVVNATTGLYALSEAQVYALYPNINSSWIRFDLTPPYYHATAGYNLTDWLVGYVGTSQMPHMQHDLVYGQGYATGIGAQWQNVSGAGKKVCVWPINVGNTTPSFKLSDQYGNWNFQYPGTKPLYIPIQLFQ